MAPAHDLVLTFDNCTATSADLAPLFARTDLDALTSLSLCEAPFVDELCAQLAAAPFARQLRELDLQGEGMTDAGAHALANGRFERLTRLDVTRAPLTEHGYDAIDGMHIVDVAGGRYDSAEE
ncbi:MAG: leucine-rich repeat domain-containing protein [Kofleriaceae bacterium]